MFKAVSTSGRIALSLSDSPRLCTAAVSRSHSAEAAGVSSSLAVAAAAVGRRVKAIPHMTKRQRAAIWVRLLLDQFECLGRVYSFSPRIRAQSSACARERSLIGSSPRAALCETLRQRAQIQSVEMNSLHYVCNGTLLKKSTILPASGESIPVPAPPRPDPPAPRRHHHCSRLARPSRP